MSTVQTISFWTGTHASSATDEWSTPQGLFDGLDSIFGFDLDVCALPSGAKCERYFTPEHDGLAQEWAGTCWMNPPYGRTIGQWMRKAWESAEQGATVVCLVPARTCTKWWHDYATKGSVTFLRGRLKFGRAESAAPFPSAVVVFSKIFAPKVLRQCTECEGIFATQRAHAKVCGNTCQVRLHRKKGRMAA